jgi:hypothetical protein
MSVSSLLLALFLAAHAQIDGPATLRGAQLTQTDRLELPNARHTADIMEVMLIAPGGAQVGGGGIDIFDATRMAVHGRSVTQLRYYWGDVDMTDPARPGQPLVDLPVAAWDTLTLHTLYTHQPGVFLTTPTQANTRSPDHPFVTVQGAIGGGDVGGGHWWPASLFDRSIAMRYGAPSVRRSLTQAHEGELRLVVPLRNGTLFLLGERFEHTHRYLTMQEPELAVRDTGVLAVSQMLGTWPLDVRIAYQLRRRNQEGAQYRFSPSEVQDLHAKAWLIQAETGGFIADGVALHVAVGGGARGDLGRNAMGPGYSEDISDTWLKLARVERPEYLTRWQANGQVRLTLTSQGAQSADPLDPQEPPVTSRYVHLLAAGNVSGWRHDDADTPARWGQRYGSQGVTMAVLENGRDGQVWQHQLRTGVEVHVPLGEARKGLDVSGGIDLSGVSDHRGLLTQAAGPSAGAAFTWRSHGLETFVMVRREPEAITAQVGDFLGTSGPQGGVYAWRDSNQDAVPDADEQGARLGGFGSGVHVADRYLRRPGHAQVAFGARSPSGYGLRLGFRGVVHALTGRYTVVDDSAEAGQQTTFHDPGGDGRGEIRAEGGGQNLPVYTGSRLPERYRLTNSGASSYYMGFETELKTEAHRRWFVHVVGAAYFTQGEAPFGSFADRNDPGIISEVSALKNNQLNARGRYDNDRSYALKIMAGVRPVTGLSLGLAARYRDGQPFTRVVIDPTLSQGPTALMAVPRGQVRHTALMQWDLRLRYENAMLKPLGVTLVCDVYNLLNAATEVAEDPRTGPTFRRALEAIPGRAVWAGLTLAFLP